MMTMFALLASAGAQEPVSAQIDWQGHPAMHLTWPILFRPGLTERTPHVTYRHMLRQVVDGPRLEASGVRIFLTAAMAAERARDPVQARRMIVRELDYVERFVAAHPDRFAMARSPEEARELLATTDKMVIVHSIEGGHHLLSGPEDAKFWADRGVALVTLIHLRDDELGGAAMLTEGVGKLINPRGARAVRRGDRRGLTDRGRAAIVELDDAGILVDFAHMAPDTVEDALAVAAAHGIAPVVTHGQLRALRDSEFAWTDERVITLYRLGGVFSLGLSPKYLDPLDPLVPVDPDVCPNTIESFAQHHAAVVSLVQAHAGEILGEGVDPTTPDARARLSVGWSSDWNGWLPHAEPVYGRGRCRPLSALTDPLPVDTLGLAHPGLLPGWWTRLEREGADLSPMTASAERFLQLWAQARR